MFQVRGRLFNKMKMENGLVSGRKSLFLEDKKSTLHQPPIKQHNTIKSQSKSDVSSSICPERQLPSAVIRGIFLW